MQPPTSSAQAYVRFTRLMRLEWLSGMNPTAVKRQVTALHERGWTAEDIAHAVVIGLNEADKPHAVIVSRLNDLVSGDVQPPRAPDETPVPPDYNPLSHRGPGTPRASEWAAKARQQIRSTP